MLFNLFKIHFLLFGLRFDLNFNRWYFSFGDNSSGNLRSLPCPLLPPFFHGSHELQILLFLSLSDLKNGLFPFGLLSFILVLNLLQFFFVLETPPEFYNFPVLLPLLDLLFDVSLDPTLLLELTILLLSGLFGFIFELVKTLGSDHCL
jgi:hypothetical protein